MRHLAAHDPGVELVGTIEVGAVASHARQQARILHAKDRLPDVGFDSCGHRSGGAGSYGRDDEGVIGRIPRRGGITRRRDGA